MNMKVKFYATLRKIVGAKMIDVPLDEGATVWDLIEEITRRYPALRSEMLDEQNKLFGHVHVFINGRDAPFLEQGLNTIISPDDEVGIFPAVGGGGDLTKVTLKFTGNVRTRMGVSRMEFSFEGSRLGDLFESLFAHHDLRDLILDEKGNILPYTRVAVNGRFSYLIGDLDAPIQEGDLVVLMKPYVVAF
jgi:molybdopterin synthase sulfur carrier subunit